MSISWGKIFLALLATFIITFFTHKNIHTVKNLIPTVLSEPAQTPVSDRSPIKFIWHGYAYELTPLYDYQISGLVVSKVYYSWFGLTQADKLFPADLCMVWGSDLAKGLHRNPNVSFSQDCRWCWVQWNGNVDFNLNEMSNNHLLINNPSLEKKLWDICASDQIQIIGKLVNVKAVNIGAKGEFETKEFTWNTSTSRADSGAGACEVIYVQDIRIIKKGNLISYWIFLASMWGMIVVAGIYLVGLFWPR
jgi:hypothetical protein